LGIFCYFYIKKQWVIYCAYKKKKSLPNSLIVTQLNELVESRYNLPYRGEQRFGVGEFAEFLGIDKDSAYRECKKIMAKLWLF